MALNCQNGLFKYLAVPPRGLSVAVSHGAPIGEGDMHLWLSRHCEAVGTPGEDPGREGSWTGAWIATALWRKDPRSPRARQHLPAPLNLGCHRGLMYY